jgi:hypothetical protein
MRFLMVGLILAVLIGGVTSAGEVDVIDAVVTRSGSERFDFDVTLNHTDTGWDHYANRWEIVAPDGVVLGVRTLYHPHVDEQPFTRSLTGVTIPQGIDRVMIRAHDSVHQLGGQTMTVELPR